MFRHPLTSFCKRKKNALLDSPRAVVPPTFSKVGHPCFVDGSVHVLRTCSVNVLQPSASGDLAYRDGLDVFNSKSGCHKHVAWLNGPTELAV